MKVDSAEIEKYLNLLNQTSRRLTKATKGFEKTRLKTRTKEQPWSVNDILAHLRSCADVWGGSIAAMLAEQKPTIPDRHPRQWVRKTNYPKLSFPESFKAFVAQRKKLLKVLKGLSFEDWSRAGIIKGREHTVFTQVRRMALHEQVHCEQIESLLQ
jgi:hypothetical protein